MKRSGRQMKGSRLGACGRVPGWLVSHFQSFVSHFFSFVSHFFSFVSQFFSFVSQFFSFVSQAGFFSFVSQAGFLWSGFRLACLPLPFICLPLLFICLPGWVLVVGFSHFLSFVSRETSRPGTRPDHPAPRRPFFKALRTPNSKLFGEKEQNNVLETSRPYSSRQSPVDAGPIPNGILQSGTNAASPQHNSYIPGTFGRLKVAKKLL